MFERSGTLKFNTVFSCCCKSFLFFFQRRGNRRSFIVSGWIFPLYNSSLFTAPLVATASRVEGRQIYIIEPFVFPTQARIWVFISSCGLKENGNKIALDWGRHRELPMATVRLSKDLYNKDWSHAYQYGFEAVVSLFSQHQKMVQIWICMAGWPNSSLSLSLPSSLSASSSRLGARKC